MKKMFTQSNAQVMEINRNSGMQREYGYRMDREGALDMAKTANEEFQDMDITHVHCVVRLLTLGDSYLGQTFTEQQR